MTARSAPVRLDGVGRGRPERQRFPGHRPPGALAAGAEMPGPVGRGRLDGVEDA
jgi:hypothetical protein